jgi:hypothetical protein
MYQPRLRVFSADIRYTLDTTRERLYKHGPVGAAPRFFWIDLAVASSAGVEVSGL